jgi:hypothetical protein
LAWKCVEKQGPDAQSALSLSARRWLGSTFRPCPQAWQLRRFSSHRAPLGADSVKSGCKIHLFRSRLLFGQDFRINLKRNFSRGVNFAACQGSYEQEHSTGIARRVLQMGSERKIWISNRRGTKNV